MKANMLKTVGAAVVLLLGGAAGTPEAHAYLVNAGALANPTDRVDVWRLECPAGTATVRADVTDGLVDGVRLGVAVVRPIPPIAGAPEKLKADLWMAPDGGNSFFADDVPVPPNVVKTFFVLIFKNGPGNLTYASEMRCDNAAGVEIGVVPPVISQEE